ncbi:hypothetical protein ACWGOK_40445 [Streptomyces eurythermus]
MQFGPQALTVPLDLVVVVQLSFMLAEQSRSGPRVEPIVVTPLTLLERLRSLGVVSGNGARLVGRDALYESFNRLVAKGYIRRVKTRTERGLMAGVSYEFYDWPAWNPDASTPADPAFVQVGSTSGNAGCGDAGSGSTGGPANGANQASMQVSSTSGNAASGEAVSGEADSGFPQVSSTSGNAGHPPHPPEEVDTSSPYPLTADSRPHPPQTEEGPEFSPEDIRQAEVFLQQMKRWQAGAATARKCAPRLLRVMRTQGWPALADLDDEQRSKLEKEIFRNTVGARSWVKCLPGWIEDLRLYDRVRSRTSADPGADGPERCPNHPSRYRAGCVPCAMVVPV